MKARKTITVCAILIAVYALSFLALFAIGGATEEVQPRDEQIYYLRAEVYGINQHGVFLLLTEDDNLWELEGLDLREDDKLLIAIDNNNTTNNKHDDVIINVYVMARPTEAQG